MNFKIKPPIGVRNFGCHGATPICHLKEFLTLPTDSPYQKPVLGEEGLKNSNLLKKINFSYYKYREVGRKNMILKGNRMSDSAFYYLEKNRFSIQISIQHPNDFFTIRTPSISIQI